MIPRLTIASSRVPKGSEADMDAAIEAARANQRRIREVAAIERIEIFREAADLMSEKQEDFIQTLMLEAGKPRKDAAGEVKATIERMRMTMEEARKIFGEYIPGDWSEDTMGKIALVIREPVGVVGAIGPFNYPLFIPAAKIIPALLAGNSVVVKPASEDPLSQLLFARVLEKAGIPPGCINVVTGTGRIAIRLATSEKVGMISFTGSTEAGRELSRLATIKQLHLELGGKMNGCYFEPTLLDHVPLDARIAWEETFGPVITIIRINSEDEAIEISSKSRYGLDSCVFTNNFYRMWKIAKRLQVGEVTINDLPRHGVGCFPFGGVKDSGIGREGIGYSIDEMTILKTIVFNLEPAGLGKIKKTPKM
ncbi:MAG: aldehyde dehydrogenase family protein [Aigarchaeota archaeon]|nr:aldehyde dehydrogenase family protein [Candidatus Pelearchaeum maunauluense]